MLFLTAASGSADLVNISIANAGIVALLGYGVVFFGLVLLMCVIMIFGKIFGASVAKKKVVEAAPAAVEPEIPAATAPGSAGQLKLYNVEPKTAAMIMAIVANKMGKPLNELRFLSIKEVE